MVKRIWTHRIQNIPNSAFNKLPEEMNYTFLSRMFISALFISKVWKQSTLGSWLKNGKSLCWKTVHSLKKSMF